MHHLTTREEVSMRTQRALQVVTAFLLTAGSATPAAARTIRGERPVVALTNRDETRFADELAQAKRLAESGEIKAAIKRYKSVLDQQREVGDYPKAALTELAYIAYGRGDVLAAAGIFDELTAAARTFGDPETQLTALVSSAMLYREAKQMVKVSDRVQAIRPLLKSPAISEKTRTDVAAMLADK